MTKDTDDDYIIDHDTDVDDGASSKNNPSNKRTSLGSTTTKELKPSARFTRNKQVHCGCELYKKSKSNVSENSIT